MFTGIITDIGEIANFTPTVHGQLHRLRIACRYDQATIADGASIACNGVCLTVVQSGVDQGKTWFEVDTAAETLRMTTAKGWSKGTRLNLERALKIGAHHVANLVTALASPGAKGVTGQLFGVRGREVFLFGQPRPVSKLAVETPATLAQDLVTKLGGQFTDMTTDLEAFNTEPLV